MSASITIRDGTAYLALDNPELMDQIIDSTSFKVEGAEYRTRDRRADKRTKLVRNNKFPVGLLDRVCRTITTFGDVPRVSYANTELAQKPRVSMKLCDVEPRDYQNEATMAAQLYDRGIFRLPTGGGKTLIALQIAIARGMHTLIVVPTIDLLHQTRDYSIAHLASSTKCHACEDGGSRHADYCEIDGRNSWKIGQLGDGVVDTQPVTIATIRTIAKVLSIAYETYEYAEYDDSDDTDVDIRALREWIKSLGTVIVDEAHQLGAKVLYEVVTGIPAVCKYGLSASPWRDDGADLMIEAATGPPVFYVPAARLVENGHLMAPEIQVIDTSTWWSSAAWGTTCASCGRQWLKWVKECTCGCKTFRSQYQESYKKEIVENTLRNGKISQKVQELDRPTLVLVKQVKHGKNLADVIPNAIFLHGSVHGVDRKAIFDAVRSGLQKVIVCTTIGDMGLDIPNLSGLVLAGGGKSSTRHLQRIGRVVRPSPGKPKPIIVDLDDSHIHSWYANHIKRRRAIEKAEWGDLATWSTG